ncbi:folate family ECF transporter S component [Tissierella carlieri]|uniref:Folate family ECF transporter S component n=1 Tax=Tissierella carlieri TaxID=689904 RepID=A0ABT1SBG3_9FIRM|nr:folate family ECF transporter S component [Tissierella carlieri]MCQ4923831.1 folate family ECF transporter S component [Tissierella carlieri]
MKNGKRIDTRILTQSAFLVALSIALTRFASIMVLPTLRIGFGELPIMLSGMLFGPIVGGISGAAADLIGIMVNPQGPPHFGFTLSSMLWGIIPGLYVLYFRRKDTKSNPFSILRVFAIVSTCYIIISLGLNTYWLSQLYNKGIIVILPSRILTALVNIPIQSMIITYLIKYLKNIVAF